MTDTGSTTRTKGRRLAKTVTLTDDDGNFQTYLKGTEPEASVAERITNPAAWEPEGEVERNPDLSWPPDGGFEAMTDGEIFAAANSTSTSTEDEDNQETLRTQKATGDHDPSATYQGATIPQLRTLANERDLDTQGLTRKQEFIDLLEKDDASNS